ncbi:hypothetical protein J2W49_004810 [Hydrogenophaga palleronii]|uniref:Uncharacterized protein n=1 Tax=Hydrogenophaga palleronii TaxID=65655 RepID=A0ABU1WU57_9BURK|nr:hypothetical protein [Hydrogenophaga palleronii]MDR7152832.1 hypothetical protein [Hydrogenophaga palleronii]
MFRRLALVAAQCAITLTMPVSAFCQNPPWKPTTKNVDALFDVSDDERKNMLATDWDVLFNRPGYQKTQLRCIEFLGFSAWLKPMFPDARLDRSVWTVSRNFASANFKGERHHATTPLRADQIKYFHKHLDWGVLQVDDRIPSGTTRAILDEAAKAGIGPLAGVGLVVIGGFTVTAGAVVGGSMTLLSIGRGYLIDEYQSSQRKAILALREDIDSEAHAFQAFTRFQTVDGRRFVREQYGLMAPDGHVPLYTCYWAETGISNGTAPSARMP